MTSQNKTLQNNNQDLKDLITSLESKISGHIEEEPIPVVQAKPDKKIPKKQISKKPKKEKIRNSFIDETLEDDFNRNELEKVLDNTIVRQIYDKMDQAKSGNYKFALDQELILPNKMEVVQEEASFDEQDVQSGVF